MAVNITYTFFPNTIIRSSQVNQNFTDVVTWSAAHEVLNTGVHGVTGNIAGTGDENTFTALQTFNKGMVAKLPHSVSNMDIVFNGTQFQFTGADRTVFSSTNKGVIECKPTDTDPLTTYTFDADSFKFEDAGGTGDMDGQIYQLEAGKASGILPAMVYFCPVDVAGTNAFFFISPNPCLKKTPSTTANIGYIGNPSSNQSNEFAQNAIWGMTTNAIAAAGFTNKLCYVVGSCRMQVDAAGAVSIESFNENDGLMRFGNYEGAEFTGDPVQMGATFDYIRPNGGSAFEFTTEDDTFNVTLDGRLRGVRFLNNDGGNDGAGAVTSETTISYYPVQSDAVDRQTQLGSIDIITPGYTEVLGALRIAALNKPALYLYRGSNATIVQNQDFSSGGRTIRMGYELQVFRSE
jgi:hypothetical protein